MKIKIDLTETQPDATTGCLEITSDHTVRNMSAEKILTALITAVNDIAIAYDACKAQDATVPLTLTHLQLKLRQTQPVPREPTTDEQLYECCQCAWHVTEAEKKEAPVPEFNNLVLNCCPNCSYHEFYMVEPPNPLKGELNSQYMFDLT
ncbi:MAG TPA: hypothetical protein VK154_15265 [Chitinophagales bacterium]|nr:hypothetical protein [Chitinophagales bacterium]